MGGAPRREWTVKSMIAEEMEMVGVDKKAAKKKVYEKLVSMAIAGDINAIKEINSRLDGMPTQPTDLTIKKIEVIIEDYADQDNSTEEATGSDKSK